MTTNLVVADMSRTEKTIGLAVSPSLKSCGIPGRPRLFEVVQKVKKVTTDHYGRKTPKYSPGTANFAYTSSTKRIVQEASELFDKIVSPDLLIRRMNISVNRLITEGEVKEEATGSEQLSIFVDYEEEERKRAEEKATLEKEKQMQTAIIDIKKRYGKNAILKGMNLEEGATAKDRNSQIGGHKA